MDVRCIIVCVFVGGVVCVDGGGRKGDEGGGEGGEPSFDSSTFAARFKICFANSLVINIDD